MEDVQYRHELKYFLNAQDAIVVRSRLCAAMSPDTHTREDGKYYIRSVYFDDANNSALWEKLNGVSHRAKFRIRIYNSDSGFIRLEKKIKVSGLGTKISVSITRDETERILQEEIGWMGTDSRELLQELYVKMRYEGLKPKTLVDYTREPFLYNPGNVRITLDSDIRSGLCSNRLFSAFVPTVPVAPGIIIMEVKYDNFLPEPVQDLIQMKDRSLGAFSKYAACRIDAHF